MSRLTAAAVLPSHVHQPSYTPAAHGTGIVHLGVGAFHRAHQAVYTDSALAAQGGDWRITGVSLRSADVATRLNPQDGRYTLLERRGDTTTARIIGALDKVLTGGRDHAAVMAVLTNPATQIVTLTVTEKAYGIDRLTGLVDQNHTAVAADLSRPKRPSGVLGLLVEALRQRHTIGTAPFTVLSCDNLSDNGALLRAGVIDFAARTAPDLARWIEDSVRFPATMVDRITPASDAQTLADAQALTKHSDPAAVETEPFSQWVIEDSFNTPRPAWEAGGALFVSDVRPYELMKLRMLNGAHSMLAYAGFLAGCNYVRDVMARSDLSALVSRHMVAAQATLPTLLAVDLDLYHRDLLARFENTAIAHRTVQIAMDGTQKLPQRLLEPATETLIQGGDLNPFAFAVAAWMRFCIGRDEEGVTYALNDPREDEIANVLANTQDPEGVSHALHTLADLFPNTLQENTVWREMVAGKLERMVSRGMNAAIAAELHP